MVKVIIQNGSSPRPTWLVGQKPRAEIDARRPEDVTAALEAAEAAAEAGMWVAGFIAYEAARGLDECHCVHESESGLPLVWFGVFEGMHEHAEVPIQGERFELGEWRENVSFGEYRDVIVGIRELIAAGDTYQVNYTFRLRADFRGSAEALFGRLVAAQRARHCAFVDCGDWAICSASPELLFELDGQRLISRPMKGTAPRGLRLADDITMREKLRKSTKDRAENAMIVDMVRNDMSRVAELGSVRVAEAFAVEKYPTVYQMTSTVECHTTARVSEIVRAMFPGASITGAPKVRTMQIIRELENSPRGIYTGAIGYVGPGRRAQFNVAIRTVSIHKPSGRAEYGVGGGIVWDSDAAAEYAECRTKSAVLGAEMPEFELLETMLLTPRDGYWLLEEHLRRLRESAEYFDFRVDLEETRRLLKQFAHGLIADVRKDRSRSQRALTLPSPAVPGEGDATKVRLLVDRDGRIKIDCAPAPRPQDRTWRLKLAHAPVDSRSVWLYHKTTCRRAYEEATATRGDCDDVLLWNERRQITETTIANVVVEIDGQRVTPPVECGLLRGVFRQHLLKTGQIHERCVTIDELARCTRMWAVNSVRGWMEARPE